MARRLALLVTLMTLGCNPTAPQAEEAPKYPDVGDLRARKAGSDWPWFLGPTGDGVSTEKGILAPWPPQGLRIVWQKQLGVGYGMPSIAKGRLYLYDRHGNQARLSCFASETGEFLWKFEHPTNYEDYFGYNNGPRCCPVVDDDRVYLHSAEGLLHCVNALDGKLVWKVDTRTEFGVVQNFFGVASVPVVEGDMLIVQVGGSPAGSKATSFEEMSALRGNESAVVAFDKRTGKVRYRVGNELASYAGPVLATVNGRRWCFVLARGGLLGLEPQTGKIDFHFPWRARSPESVNAANPVVVHDRVLISETYGPGSALLRVKPGGYEVLWTDEEKGRKKSLQAHWATPIHHDGYVYGCSGRHLANAELRCIELATGKVMWSQPDLTRTSLMLVDGHFVCIGEDGLVLLLKVNPHKYEEVSRLTLHLPQNGQRPLLEEPCWAAPILSHGLLYLRGRDRLVCLELIPAREIVP
jgi:outer membrane protein assembly factor BamB